MGCPLSFSSGERRRLSASGTSTGSSVVTSVQETTNYKNDPDVQLMLRVRDGDDTAFTPLVEKYQDRLVAIFTNMFGAGSQAEDLAQEAFLRVYRARRGYEPTAKFSTWLFQIATNVAHNSRRTQGRRKEVQFADGADSQAVRAGESLVPEKSAMMPTRMADRSELKQRIHEAMQMLGERQRMALLLHKFEGMQYTEIGEIMEMTPQAVKSLLSRARESLRTALESYVK